MQILECQRQLLPGSKKIFPEVFRVYDEEE
jgi:hypothetical protein